MDDDELQKALEKSLKKKTKKYKSNSRKKVDPWKLWEVLNEKKLIEYGYIKGKDIE